MVMAERLLTIREAAERWGVSYETARRWVDKGVVEAVRVGPTGQIRIRETVVAQLIEPYRKEVDSTS